MVRRRGAPRVGAWIRLPPCGLLPLRLARQPLARPLTVRVGPRPVHPNHWVGSAGRAIVIGRTGPGRVARSLLCTPRPPHIEHIARWSPPSRRCDTRPRPPDAVATRPAGRTVCTGSQPIWDGPAGTGTVSGDAENNVGVAVGVAVAVGVGCVSRLAWGFVFRGGCGCPRASVGVFCGCPWSRRAWGSASVLGVGVRFAVAVGVGVGVDLSLPLDLARKMSLISCSVKTRRTTRPHRGCRGRSR